MAGIDLSEYETRIRARTLRSEDYARILEIQRACFPGMGVWRREQFESQLRLFPAGQVGIEVDGALVASSSSLIVDFDLYADWHKWSEIADGGYIRNHNPDGDTLYGIEIMVHPDNQGMRLSRRLYAERKRIAREHNLERIIIGGRIPGYHKFADSMTAREYVEQVINKAAVDPVLTAQLANGFVLKRLIPNYLPSDKESCGYATFLEWTNLDHVPATRRRFQAVALTRISLVQYQLRPIETFDDFARQCEYFVDVAADYRSDFVVFPELISTQLLSYLDAPRPGLAVRKLAEQTPACLELFSHLAIKYDINVIGGSHFSLEGERLKIEAYLCRRDGTLERQQRLHVLPSERRWWGVEPGEGLRAFDTDRGRVALVLGYDLLFPEVVRAMASQKADLIFVPFDADDQSAYQRIRVCAQARAIENSVCVAIAGCVGNLPFVGNADVHYAQAGIFTPADYSFPREGIAAEATPNTEALLTHDVDLEVLRRHRHDGTVRVWEDRRTDLYGLRYRDGEESRDV